MNVSRVFNAAWAGVAEPKGAPALQRSLVYCAVVGNLRKKYDKRPLLLSLAISRLPETERSHGKAT